MAVATKPWSVQDHLGSTERQAGFLEAALGLAVAEGDPGFFAVALGEVAKARGIAEVAEATGLTRAGLYKALSREGDPRLSSLLGILGALDLRLAVQPKAAARRPRRTTPTARRERRGRARLEPVDNAFTSNLTNAAN